jgi:hypothetical protein
MSKKLLMSVAPLLATVAFVVMPAVAQAHEPVYWVNGAKLPRLGPEEGKPVPYVSWGTLTLSNSLNPAHPVTCENAVGGSVWNPEGAESPGEEVTNGWTAYNCKQEECDNQGGKLQVLMENEATPGLIAGVGLEWKGKLNGNTSNTTIKLKSTNVKVFVSCQFAAVPPEETVLSAPLFVRTTSEVEAEGTNCTTNEAEGGVQNPLNVNESPYHPEPAKPQKLKFGAGGELYCTVKFENPETKVVEEVKSKGATSGTLKTLGYGAVEGIQTRAIG